jgi:hypothetical protein
MTAKVALTNLVPGVALGLATLAGLPAHACGINARERSTISISDYNPLSPTASTRDFTVTLRGQPLQSGWIRLQARSRSSALPVSFRADTGNGMRLIGGGGSGAAGLDPASLGQHWAPLAFDARGQADVTIGLTVPAGLPLHAGVTTAALDAIVACAADGMVREDIMPFELGTLEVRVPSLIGVSRRGGTVLDFGTIPARNVAGFSPQGARASFDVTATGGFSVEIGSRDLVMRNQEIEADGRLDAIAYDLAVSDGRGGIASGSGGRLTCGPALSGHTVDVAASLFANAAMGKLAGRYRDTVTVTISPDELSNVLPGQCTGRTR